MPRKKETYKATVALVIAGESIAPGEEFEATEGEVAHLVEPGAVKKVERKDEKKDERRSP